MKRKAMNAEKDGTARTIKAQYWKNSLANFVRGGDWGATAVIEVYEEDDSDKCDERGMCLHDTDGV